MLLLQLTCCHIRKRKYIRILHSYRPWPGAFAFRYYFRFRNGSPMPPRPRSQRPRNRRQSPTRPGPRTRSTWRTMSPSLPRRRSRLHQLHFQQAVEQPSVQSHRMHSAHRQRRARRARQVSQVVRARPTLRQVLREARPCQSRVLQARRTKCGKPPVKFLL